MTKEHVEIQLLCYNEDCNADFVIYHSIWELLGNQGNGEVKCEKCGHNNFSIVIRQRGGVTNK